AFTEGREIVWRTAPHGEQPPGHQWGWELEPLADGGTRVTHRYDFTDLPDAQEQRLAKARLMTPEKLRASLDRLAALAEEVGGSCARRRRIRRRPTRGPSGRCGITTWHASNPPSRRRCAAATSTTCPGPASPWTCPPPTTRTGGSTSASPAVTSTARPCCPWSCCCAR